MDEWSRAAAGHLSIHPLIHQSVTFRWKEFRHRLEEVGSRLLMWSVPKLSRSGCLRMADSLGALAYLLDARGRGVAMGNLECAFGDRFSSEQRREMVRASYRNFLRTMLDLFWARNLTPGNFREWMKPEGFDELCARLARERRGAVFFCVHQGNWEWASLVFGFLGLPTTIVAENFKNPRLTALFNQAREVTGHRIIAQENSLLRMLRIVKRGGATGMLIDLNLRPSQAATIIEGFGLKMCVPLLHTVLAQRANALLVPVETIPQPDGTCRVIAHPGVEWPEGSTLQQIAQCCWNAFEPILRERPELWLSAYKHFRYRPQNAGRPYPAYANESAKFEKLLRTPMAS